MSTKINIVDLNEEVKFLKRSLDEVHKSVILMKEQLDKLFLVFNWHGHTETRITNPPLFLRDQYEMAQKQEQQQQQQQKPPEPDKKVPEPEKPKGE